jgi:hypothetical protein
MTGRRSGGRRSGDPRSGDLRSGGRPGGRYFASVISGMPFSTI